jgi:hypothetical protein
MAVLLKTKSESVKDLLTQGNFNEALRQAKSFKLGLTKAEKSTLKRGYECIDNASFYAQLGLVPSVCIAEAVIVLCRLNKLDHRTLPLTTQHLDPEALKLLQRFKKHPSEIVLSDEALEVLA